MQKQNWWKRQTEEEVVRKLSTTQHLNMINPTRISNLSPTLLAVILTNRPDIFTKGETYNPYIIIFNHCIAEGFWSTKRKMGEWTPVFKKGDKQAKENYRLLSVLPFPEKLKEYRNEPLRFCITHIQWSTLSSYPCQSTEPTKQAFTRSCNLNV